MTSVAVSVPGNLQNTRSESEASSGEGESEEEVEYLGGGHDASNEEELHELLSFDVENDEDDDADIPDHDPLSFLGEESDIDEDEIETDRSRIEWEDQDVNDENDSDDDVQIIIPKSLDENDSDDDVQLIIPKSKSLSKQLKLIYEIPNSNGEPAACIDEASDIRMSSATGDQESARDSIIIKSVVSLKTVQGGTKKRKQIVRAKAFSSLDVHRCFICRRDYSSAYDLHCHRLRMGHSSELETAKPFACGICRRPWDQPRQALACAVYGHDPSIIHAAMFCHSCPMCPEGSQGYHNLRAVAKHWSLCHPEKKVPEFLLRIRKDFLPKIKLTDADMMRISETLLESRDNGSPLVLEILSTGYANALYAREFEIFDGEEKCERNPCINTKPGNGTVKDMKAESSHASQKVFLTEGTVSTPATGSGPQIIYRNQENRSKSLMKLNPPIDAVPADRIVKDKTGYKFECGICGRFLKTRDILLKHRTIHNKIRYLGLPKYKCMFCDKKYHLGCSFISHRLKSSTCKDLYLKYRLMKGRHERWDTVLPASATDSSEGMIDLEMDTDSSETMLPASVQSSPKNFELASAIPNELLEIPADIGEVESVIIKTEPIDVITENTEIFIAKKTESSKQSMLGVNDSDENDYVEDAYQQTATDLKPQLRRVPESTVTTDTEEHVVVQLQPLLDIPSRQVKEEPKRSLRSNTQLLDCDTEIRSALDDSCRCGICGKVLQFARNLKRHMKGHESTNPALHSCKVCNKSFDREWNWKRHMKLHFKKNSKACSGSKHSVLMSNEKLDAPKESAEINAVQGIAAPLPAALRSSKSTATPSRGLRKAPRRISKPIDNLETCTEASCTDHLTVNVNEKSVLKRILGNKTLIIRLRRIDMINETQSSNVD